ncbi:MAG: FadR/GntR family transcriptional regulator [Xanthobacteraceae bacterium]
MDETKPGHAQATDRFNLATGPIMRHKRIEQTFSPQSLADRITVSLREAIVNGQYGPGEQLPAGKSLALQFGVSITVVREALSRLKADGLVGSRQGKGVFVAKDKTARPFRLTGGTSRALLDVFELRIGVEVQAARLAAERRTARDLKQMEKCLKAMEPARKSFDEALDADIEFHRAIAVATRNPLIVSFMEFLQPHLRDAIALARKTSARQANTQFAAFEEHREIYEAIAAGDQQRAGNAVRGVIEGSLRRLENISS